MLIPQIMTTEISITKLLGSSAYGEVYSSSATTKGLVEQGFKKVVNSTGQEVISSAFLILYPTVNIAPGDKVTINSANYEVVDVQPVNVFGAVHHKEVYLASVV